MPKTFLTSAKKVNHKKRCFHWLLSQPFCKQSYCVWAVGKKLEVDENRLLVQRVIAPHVMVSSGVCFNGKRRLHFIPERPRWTLNFTLILCYRNWLQTARLCCQLASFSQRTVRCTRTHCTCGTRLDRHQLHRIHRQRCMRVTSKLSGPESTGMDCYVWGDRPMLESYATRFRRSWKASTSWRMSCS